MIYDIIILGGGIAGMNCAYQILKKTPNAHILILEKESILGGRVQTTHTRYMDVEAGAGRFHDGQPHIMKIIRELGLSSHMSKLTSTASYANGSGKITNSILDQPMPTSYAMGSILPSIQPSMMAVADYMFGKENLPNAWLITKIVLASYITPEETLIDNSLLTFAKTVLNDAEIQLLKDSFGYYSELVLMNAKDALHLIVAHLSPLQVYYGLTGGLSQIIRKLESTILTHMNVRILKKRSVNRIRYINWRNEPMFEIGCSNVGTLYYGKKCICAMPKPVVEKIKFFQLLVPVLSKIKCAPLCRIYSKFPKIGNRVWFKGLPKLTSNSPLRMIIPINEQKGVIMSSYSDNKFAKYWKGLYDKEGESGLNAELIRLLQKNTGRTVPLPIKTEIYYWECGVGYWGVGANSAKISKELIQPFGESVAMFLCGEPYSEKNQQWMEGALETGMEVVNRVLL
jgi:monoamine oxidase